MKKDSAVDIEWAKRNEYNIAGITNSLIDFIEGFGLFKEDIIYFVNKYFDNKLIRYTDIEVDGASQCDYCSNRNLCKNKL